MVALEKNELYIADPAGPGWPSAPTGRLIDFSDLDCDPDAGGFGFEDAPNFADDAFEDVSLGSYAHDGDEQAAYRYRNRVLHWLFYYKNKPTTEIVADLQLLADALRTHGVLVWQMRGMADPEYFDFKPSPIPQQLRGLSGQLERVTIHELEVNGIPLDLTVYPWPRLETITLAAKVVDNDPIGSNRYVEIDNPGNMPSEVHISLDETDSENLAGVRAAIRATGNLTEYLSKFAFAASGADFSDGYDTSAVVVADATGGSAALIDFATEEGHVKRLRCPITLADDQALAGVHRAFARVTPYSGATRGRYTIQARHGFTDDPYAMVSGPKLPFDFRDTNPQNFVEVDLGFVTVPVGVDQVNIDLHVGRKSGDYELAVDQVLLEPADYWRGYCTVPGHRLGAWSPTRYEAEDLDGDGILKRDTYRITQFGDQAFTPAIPLAAGIHSFEVELSIREPDDPGITDGDNPVEAEIGEFSVYETTGPAIIGVCELRNRRNRKWTNITRTINFEVSAADVLADRLYQGLIDFTAATLSGRRIQVHSFRHRYLRAVTQDTPIVIDSNLWNDGADRGARAESAPGISAFPMVLENDPPLVPGGPSVMLITPLDLPTDPGYDAIDDREPLARVVLDRDMSVVVTLTPRVSHP